MTALLKLLFRGEFDHPATVENLGVAPKPTPGATFDAFTREEYLASMNEMLELGKDLGSNRPADESVVEF